MKLPWWVKIGAKLVLSRIPMSRRIWRHLGVFRHGDMDDYEYATNVFKKHLSATGQDINLGGRRIMELGPGDGVATAVIVAACGGYSTLVDVGNFVDDDAEVYIQLSEQLRKEGLSPPRLGNASTTTDVLDICNAEYLTNGLESLAQVPDESVDFIFSQAVLEHVRVADFLYMMRECYRVLKRGETASHRVDLRDHLGGGLNNLRIPSSIWEKEWFAGSGFYTNRISFTEMKNWFKAAGFSIQSLEVNNWSSPPIERKKVAKEFQDRSDEDFHISGFDVVLKKT